MKKQSHTFILGGFTLFATYLYYLSANPLPPTLTIKESPLINVQNEEAEALNYLNSLRIGAGLIPFQGHTLLNKAAKNHANYLTNHLTFGHRENKTHRDFTGEFASSRVQHVGYATPQVIENVSTHNQNYKESINGLFSAIYHRIAFLDFRSDSIGIGISQHPQKRTQTAFVYNMSSLALEKLYQKNVKISSQNITQALDYNKRRNKNVVIYPFNKQREVPPAFFDELPDPLPEHRVSGFPISVFFNSLYHKEVKLLKFQLFNKHGKEVTNTLIYDHKTDPNKRLEKMDFVLFPLERLEWNSQYHVNFQARVDNKIVHKKWSFQTQKFNLPVHVVKDDNTIVKMNQTDSRILYFPPRSKVDLLHDIAYPANIDIEFVDKNTIKLTALACVNKQQKLLIGNHRLIVDIKN